MEIESSVGLISGANRGLGRARKKRYRWPGTTARSVERAFNAYGT